jgi:hypothetical protein
LHHGVVDTIGSVCATTGAYIVVPISRFEQRANPLAQHIATLPFEKLVNKACDGDDGNRLQQYE